MHRFIRPSLLLMLSCTLMPPADALAQDGAAAPPAPPAPSTSPAPALAPLAPEPVVPREHLSPVVAEIMTALEEQRTLIRSLRAELASSRDSRRSLELQRAIALAKQDTELRLLRIQADHARRAGRVEVAAALDAAIGAMTRPAEAPVTRSRPTLSTSR